MHVNTEVDASELLKAALAASAAAVHLEGHMDIMTTSQKVSQEHSQSRPLASFLDTSVWKVTILW